MYETITCTITSDHIMVITLNRPERLNAFNELMLSELISCINEADHNDKVRAVIFTGEGKAFCAGADLESGGTTFEEKKVPIADYRDTGGILSLRLFDCKKPVIAAINGSAVGVGLTMTLPMDIRIASTQAKMGFVFCRRGIAPEACSSWFLPRLVGIGKAQEWVLTGRIFSVEEAFEGGLIHQIVEPDELLPSALSIAREIAENTSATSVALSRQLLWKMLGADHPLRSHEIESKIIYWSGQQADAIEGINSFLEKRKPQFQLKVSSDLPDFYPWWTKTNE